MIGESQKEVSTDVEEGHVMSTEGRDFLENCEKLAVPLVDKWVDSPARSIVVIRKYQVRVSVDGEVLDLRGAFRV